MRRSRPRSCGRRDLLVKRSRISSRRSHGGGVRRARARPRSPCDSTTTWSPSCDRPATDGRRASTACCGRRSDCVGRYFRAGAAAMQAVPAFAGSAGFCYLLVHTGRRPTERFAGRFSWSMAVDSGQHLPNTHSGKCSSPMAQFIGTGFFFRASRLTAIRGTARRTRHGTTSCAKDRRLAGGFLGAEGVAFP